jgi:hypothetical protein
VETRPFVQAHLSLDKAENRKNARHFGKLDVVYINQNDFEKQLVVMKSVG